MKIFIAENDSLILKTVELKFRKDGFEVICCSDKDALLKIQMQKPDIILMDIKPPGFSCLEVLKWIKSDPEKQVPVIVFFTAGQEEIMEEAFRLGASDFVEKPFSLAELSLRIKRLLPVA